jgi:23S rRNA pseudouridine1911/1915/1917 synthase
MASASDDLANKYTPKILYEDERILALDKPAGLVVHSDGRTVEPSVVDWLRERFPGLENVGGLHTLDSGRYVERFGLVHRLDRETSGVLLVAKDTETFHVLQRQFIARTSEKRYMAFVWGIPTEREGDIDLPIGRSREDFRQWTTGDAARGNLRKALTHYQVISSTKEASYLELLPKTGRTHQLRVHLKAIGHPIICDKRYGSACGLGFSRTALHAMRLTINHPVKGRMVFEAPLPPDFLFALGKGFSLEN